MTCAIARLPCAAISEVYTVVPQMLGGNVKHFATRTSRIAILHACAVARARIPSPRLPR